MATINRSGVSAELIEELREDFATVDADQDGWIDFPEFTSLMDHLNAEMSHEDLRTGFGVIDADGDGRISLAEFVAWRSQG